MLRAQNLTKLYGDQPIVDNVSFLLNPGERLALVGRNGSGKTTLFRMIQGEEGPDSGEIIAPRGYRIGHLEQHLVFTEPTLIQETCLVLGDRVEELKYKAEAALMGLGFRREDFERPPGEFSGGYQIRINLAKLLIDEPNLLLLDEPTNYLDIVSLRWLRRFLRNWPHELMLISHDRVFLNRVCTHTMMIHRSGLRRIQGSVEKLAEQIEMEERVHEHTRLNQEKKIRQEMRFVERFRAKDSKAKAVQSRLKQIAKRGQLEALDSEGQLDFSFRPAPFAATTMIEAKEVSFGYDPVQPLFRELGFTVERGDRVAVIGRNGKGKTTLLNVLAHELEPTEGSLRENPNVEMAYFGQTNVDRLDPEMTIEEEILSVHPEHSRTAARSICGLVLFEGDLALKKIAVLSGGERSRVLLGKLLVRPANLLLLDEPTNHLDLESVESLLDAVESFPGAVVIVTHSEMILERIANRLIVFDGERPFVFEGGYRDFLDRVGWAEESDGATKKAPKVNRKELRRRRAELVSARSKASGPLRKKVERLEEEITRIEAEVEAHNAEMIEASHENNVALITFLATKTKEKEARISEAFEELEHASELLEEANADYDRKLAELGDG